MTKIDFKPVLMEYPELNPLSPVEWRVFRFLIGIGHFVDGLVTILSFGFFTVDLAFQLTSITLKKQVERRKSE